MKNRKEYFKDKAAAIVVFTGLAILSYFTLSDDDVWIRFVAVGFYLLIMLSIIIYGVFFKRYE